MCFVIIKPNCNCRIKIKWAIPTKKINSYSDSNKRSKCNERCSKRSVEFGIYHTEPVASTTTMNVPAYLFKEAFSHLTSSCIFHRQKETGFFCLIFDFVPKYFSYF